MTIIPWALLIVAVAVLFAGILVGELYVGVAAMNVLIGVLLLSKRLYTAGVVLLIAAILAFSMLWPRDAHGSVCPNPAAPLRQPAGE
jgi:hypothetical protein